MVSNWAAFLCSYGCISTKSSKGGCNISQWHWFDRIKYYSIRHFFGSLLHGSFFFFKMHPRFSRPLNQNPSGCLVNVVSVSHHSNDSAILKKANINVITSLTIDFFEFSYHCKWASLSASQQQLSLGFSLKHPAFKLNSKKSIWIRTETASSMISRAR